MSKEEKIRAIQFLNDSGAFLITKSGDKVCKLFGISKYTLYSYIDEAKAHGGLLIALSQEAAEECLAEQRKGLGGIPADVLALQRSAGRTHSILSDPSICPAGRRT